MAENRRLAMSEFVARYRDDFEGFLALLEIVPQGAHGEELTPRPLLPLKSTQRSFIATSTGKDIVLKARKVGMTTIACARDLWWLLTRPAASVLVVCQSDSQDQYRVNIGKILDAMIVGIERHAILPWATRARGFYKIEGHPGELRIIVSGASKAKAQKTGRGGTPHRLHITEVAFFEYADETFTALLTSAPNAETVIESTPNGARGLFYEMWKKTRKGENGYTPHFHPWFVHDDNEVHPTGDALKDAPLTLFEPKTDRERAWLERGLRPGQILWWRLARGTMSADKMEQEHPSDEQSCWLLTGRGYFEQPITMAMLDKAQPPLERRRYNGVGIQAELRLYRQPARNAQYVVSVDTSEGVGGDPCAVHVYERGTGAFCAVLDGQVRTWELAGIVKETAKRFNNALVVVERNGPGVAVLQALTQPTEHRYGNMFVEHDGRYGWRTDNVTRPAALAVLEQAHRTGYWKCDDPAVLGDFLNFVVRETPAGKERPEADKGAHDDHVLAAAIGWNVICRPTQQQRSLPPVV